MLRGKASHPQACNARWRSTVATLALGLFTVTWSPCAQAEAASPSGKGIVGGTLLGAELTVFGEAAFGLERPWLYWVGAAAGAGAGGVGGYFLEQSASTEMSFYALLTGMALTIPATIVYLDATAASGDLDREGPEDGPNYDEEPLPDEFSQLRPAKPPIAVVPALLVWRGTPELGVPDLRVGPNFSKLEQDVLGLPNNLRWSTTLVSGVF